MGNPRTKLFGHSTTSQFPRTCLPSLLFPWVTQFGHTSPPSQMPAFSCLILASHIGLQKSSGSSVGPQCIADHQRTASSRRSRAPSQVMSGPLHVPSGESWQWLRCSNLIFPVRTGRQRCRSSSSESSHRIGGRDGRAAQSTSPRTARCWKQTDLSGHGIGASRLVCGNGAENSVWN